MQIVMFYVKNSNYEDTKMAIDIIFKITGVGLLTFIVNMILKKSDKDEIATFVTIAGLIIVLVMILDMIGGLFDSLKSILNLY